MFILSENTSVENQIINLTSYMFHKHYCENDAEYIIEQMDNDIVWIGAAEHEFKTGLENVSSVFEEFKGKIPKCNISDEEYHVIKIAPKAYLCSGRMWIATDESTKISLRAHQRVTMIFREYDGYIKCCHIHISNPYCEMVDDDMRFSYKNVKAVI